MSFSGGGLCGDGQATGSLGEPIQLWGRTEDLTDNATEILSLSFVGGRKDKIKLIFDQEVKWEEEIIERFYLDDSSAEVTAVGGSGKTITLKLTGPSIAKEPVLCQLDPMISGAQTTWLTFLNRERPMLELQFFTSIELPTRRVHDPQEGCWNIRPR